MTAKHVIYLSCELEYDGCQHNYPAKPVEGTVGALRKEARDAGWETLKNTAGRDVCPPCRIVEITSIMKA